MACYVRLASGLKCNRGGNVSFPILEYYDDDDQANLLDVRYDPSDVALYAITNTLAPCSAAGSVLS